MANGVHAEPLVHADMIITAAFDIAVLTSDIMGSEDGTVPVWAALGTGCEGLTPGPWGAGLC